MDFTYDNIQFRTLNDLLNYKEKTLQGTHDIYHLKHTLDLTEGRYFCKEVYLRVPKCVDSKKWFKNYFITNKIPATAKIQGILESRNRVYYKLEPNQVLSLPKETKII